MAFIHLELENKNNNSIHLEFVWRYLVSPGLVVLAEACAGPFSLELLKDNLFLRRGVGKNIEKCICGLCGFAGAL